MKNKIMKVSRLAAIPMRVVDQNDSLRALSETEAAPRRMLWQRPEIRRRIRNMIRVVVRHADSREELRNDALTHLWQTELCQPSRRLSWYLQSCRFFILNRLKDGRSLDSLKRRHLGCSIDDGAADSKPCSGGEFMSVEDVVQNASVRDVFSQLRCRLNRLERRIFVLLFAGFGVREIARRMHITHQAVIRSRRRIADLARQIGFCPEPGLLAS